MNKDKLSAIAGNVIKWSVFTVLFTAPFSKSLAEIGICTAIACWVLKKVLSKDLKLKGSVLTIPLIIFLIAAIPSFFNSTFLALSIKAFFTKMLKYVVLYFVIIDEFDSKEKIKSFFYIGFASIIVITLDGFFQYLYGTDILHNYPTFKSRYDIIPVFKGFPTASFPFPNDLSAWILLMIFPLGCACLFDLKETRFRYFATAAFVMLFCLFFMAKVRAAWLAFLASSIYLVISSKKIWLILFFVVLIATPYVLHMQMSQYIFAFSSMEHRFGMWDTGWEIFKKHPIIGNGINTFFENFRIYRNDEDKGKRGSYAHNCYLQMAADTGIIGLASFLLVIVTHFISVIKNLKKINDPLFLSVFWGMSIGIFAFLVHAFFDTNLYSLNLAILFWISVGISHSIGLTCAEREI